MILPTPRLISGTSGNHHRQQRAGPPSSRRARPTRFTFRIMPSFEPVGASVWYAWTAPTNGIAAFNTVGSGFDTVLSVWTTTNGLCGPTLTNIVADDDSGGNSTSALTFPAVAGTTYRICVEGYDYGYPGLRSRHRQHRAELEPKRSNTSGTIPSGTFIFATASSITWEHSDTAPLRARVSPRFLWSANRIPSSRETLLSTPSLIGARVTVTRTNGYSGRVFVDYRCPCSLTPTSTRRIITGRTL